MISRYHIEGAGVIRDGDTGKEQYLIRVSEHEGGEWVKWEDVVQVFTELRSFADSFHNRAMATEAVASSMVYAVNEILKGEDK